MTVFLGAAMVAALSGCGGGGGSGSGSGGSGGGSGTSPTPPPSPPPPETLFVPANAWTSTLPADAEMITPEEFRRRLTAGESELFTSVSQQAVKTAADARVAEAIAFLESRTDLGDEVAALLVQAKTGTFEGSSSASLPDGRRVALMGLGARLENAADAYRRSHDPVNARAAYRLSYDLLPPAVRSQLPAPDTLQSASLEQLLAATSQLDGAARSIPEIDNVRLDPEAPLASSPASVMRKIGPGNGTDNSGPCTPTNLVRRFWFPLRSFISPVKNQGNRGTCWAFTAIAAVESRERVQNDNAVDLSEQFLVNKFKREWFANDFRDGASSAEALNAATARNQPLLSESGWTYNSAPSRTPNAFDAGVEGSANSYLGTCAGYTGWCSATAHQSNESCTSVLGANYCSYDKFDFTGPGVAASRVVSVWTQGQPFNLAQYRALLASGVSLLASFPVYDGFMSAPASGIVSDYRKLIRDDKGKLVEGSYGGHAVQVVGFISNEQLSFPGSNVNVGGGGYFIIRNSWACAADGGFFYVPADYVSQHFNALEMLDFDTRRSSRWTADQATPGGASGLAVDPGGASIVDLRVHADIAASFTVTHPVASYVRLTVTSNRDGTLYDGQWMVNQPIGGSLFTNTLPVNLQTEGLRTLTITARYGSQTISATKNLTALNSSPSITLAGNGSAAQGENFVVDAEITDRNETNFGPLCDATTWSVTAPDIIVSGTGCTRVIRFGASGFREVQVSTHDSEGLAASRIVAFYVLEPPVNPYPRITAYGLYSRDIQLFNGQVSGCTDRAVAGNTAIDLRQKGCNLGIGAAPWRYFGSVTVENPGNEALSYDWTYSLSNVVGGPVLKTSVIHTTAPSVDFAPVIFGGLNTAYPCSLDVRVNAPDASRTKAQRVWTGRCINIEEAPK